MGDLPFHLLLRILGPVSLLMSRPFIRAAAKMIFNAGNAGDSRENASAPVLNGATRIRYVTITGDIMVAKGSPMKTPQGMITPIDEWRRAR
jgi:hypothetical protein